MALERLLSQTRHLPHKYLALSWDLKPMSKTRPSVMVCYPGTDQIGNRGGSLEAHGLINLLNLVKSQVNERSKVRNHLRTTSNL